MDLGCFPSKLYFEIDPREKGKIPPQIPPKGGRNRKERVEYRGSKAERGLLKLKSQVFRFKKERKKKI